MAMRRCKLNIILPVVAVVSFSFVVPKPVFVTQMSLNNVGITNETYQHQRQTLLISERLKRLGGELVLNAAEQKVDQILLSAKQKEVEDSLVRGQTFASSENFLLSKPKFEASAVFKMLKKMPKGMMFP